MRCLRVITVAACLFGVTAACDAQSLRKSFYSTDEWATAVRFGIDADDQEWMLALELHHAYLAESTEDFHGTAEEVKQLSQQLIEGILSQEAFHEKRDPIVIAYTERQSQRDVALQSDLRMLLGTDEEKFGVFARLLERGGGRCHPLLAWSKAFGDEALPPEAIEIIWIYSDQIERLLTAQRVLAETPPGRSDRAKTLQALRQLRNHATIDARSDACADQIAELLPAGDARGFLQAYYRMRSPRYFNTPVDAKLASISLDRLAEPARRQIEGFEEKYWAMLRPLNRKVMEAHTNSAEAGVELSVKESTRDLDAARAVVLEARAEREEQLKLLLAELEQILAAIEQPK